MKKKDWLQLLKFTLFSISAAVIQVCTETFLLEVCNMKGSLAWLAYLTGLVLSVLWNFTFNRKFTFKSANNVPIAMLKVAAYYAVFTPLSTLWTDYFVDTLGVNEYIVLVVTLLINFVTEFTFDKFVVFRVSKKLGAGFIAGLTREERRQFKALFVAKDRPVIANMPAYKSGRNNREFFTAALINMPKLRPMMSEGLTAKFYKQFERL